jgi:hypothetical protein
MEVACSIGSHFVHSCMYIHHLPFSVAIDSRELCPLRTLHEICMTLAPLGYFTGNFEALILAI